MFTSLFTSVSNTTTTEKVDRRRAARQRIDGAGELSASSGGSRAAAMPVEVRDISATGVGLVHDVPLAVGQKFVVKQDLLPPHGPRLFTVVRSDATAGGRYSIGLHASNLLDPHAAVQPRRSDKSRAILTVVASLVLILAVAALMMY